MKKLLALAALVSILLLLAPAVAMAAGEPDALQGFIEALKAVRDLTRDFYCAAGIVAFCP